MQLIKNTIASGDASSVTVLRIPTVRMAKATPEKQAAATPNMTQNSLNGTGASTRSSDVLLLPASLAIFWLVAEPAGCMASLADSAPLEMRRLGPEVFEVFLPGTDQAAIDRAVDRLRAGSISLISMTRKVQTLEEAFLGILEQARSR